MAVRIKSVNKGSAAEKLGLRAGDTLLSADGNEINDMLDYQFYTSGPSLHLAVQRGGKLEYLQAEKGDYEPFGCEFETYLIDKKHSCANHCMFCFIDQMPKGLRETLYFKDDDERLSFLFGNYITLTNLSEREAERIIKMHISPINISVHTTDPDLRVRMMANKNAGKVLAYLDRFAEAGIQMNFQLVLCRGVNDGAALEKTLEDLCALYPAAASIAAVPSGLTRYRKGLYPLTAYDAQSSREVLDILERWGNRCKELVVQLLEAEPKPIFIDEADRLRIDRIEDLRDIHEMTGAPVVLIGEEGIFGLLHERRRIWSRIAYEVEFGPVSPAEIALYAQQAAGLDLPLSLSTEIAQKTEGDFRLVRNMCLLLERSAKASGSFAVDQKMLDTAFSARSWRRK